MRKILNSARALGKGPSRRTFRLRRGFTLIEMLIVTAILSVVSLAIYSTFSSGIRIWKRVNASPLYEDQVIFFDRLGHDLRNAIVLSATPLSGSDERLEFPLTADSPRMGARTVSKAGYVYEAESGAIKRWQQDYSAMFTGSKDVMRSVLAGISQARFSYYFYKTDEKVYAWADRWSQASFPLAVRLELEFDAAHGGGNVTRTFPVLVSRAKNNGN